MLSERDLPRFPSKPMEIGFIRYLIHNRLQLFHQRQKLAKTEEELRPLIRAAIARSFKGGSGAGR